MCPPHPPVHSVQYSRHGDFEKLIVAQPVKVSAFYVPRLLNNILLLFSVLSHTNPMKASYPPSINSILIVSPSTSMSSRCSVSFTLYDHNVTPISVLSTCLFDQDSSVVIAARRSGDRIPVGTRSSTPVQTGPGAHPASYTMGTGG